MKIDSRKIKGTSKQAIWAEDIINRFLAASVRVDALYTKYVEEAIAEGNERIQRKYTNSKANMAAKVDALVNAKSISAKEIIDNREEFDRYSNLGA